MKITDSLGLNKNITSSQDDDIHNQCSSPIGSMDSIVVVESENGDRHDFTTLQVCETNLIFQVFSNIEKIHTRSSAAALYVLISQTFSTLKSMQHHNS